MLGLHMSESTNKYNMIHIKHRRSMKPTAELSEEQRLKQTARAYAGVYKRRGKLIPRGSTDVHTRLLDIISRECHRLEHKGMYNIFRRLTK